MRHFIIIFLSFSYLHILVANQIVVKLTPENKAVQQNIEAYIGSYEQLDRLALQRLQKTVIKQATQASQALGYYNTKISSHVSRKSPKLYVYVTLGEPIKLNQVDIDIEGNPEEISVFKKPKSKDLKPGAILNQGAYDNAKSSIQEQALQYGFFFGVFTKHQLLIDPEQNQADIFLNYLAGPRSRLGSVTFSGSNNPFHKELLDRFVSFQPGIPYNASELAKLNNDLQSTGYFDLVRVTAIPTDQDHLEIPVQVELSAVKSRILETSLGYSTDVGPRAKFSWIRPWINSRGHQLGFSTEVSAVKQNITSWYQIPLKDPLTEKLRFTGGLQHEDVVDTESNLWVLGAEYNKKLHSGWNRTLSLRLMQEDYTIEDESTDTQLYLIPGVNFSYFTSDNNTDPSQGYRLSFDFSTAKKNMLSEVDFFRYNIKAIGLYTFQRRHRILLRGEVGGIQTNNFKDISPSLRFFTGGDQSVRGYGFQTLSPKNKNNKKIGGRYLLVGSTEYQYTFAEHWRAAMFVDKGNAMDSWGDNLKTGVGVGIRWISPVGPIRVDLARGIEDKSLRLHFAIGPEL